MNRERILEKVRQTLSGRLAVTIDDVGWDSLLQEDLEADSLDLVELAIMMEEEFGVEIPDDQLGEIRTVGDTVELIQAKLGVKS
ncbi:MAG: acyl carrier protein [Actinomycetota bacterium]|nr:acyl carrier protein [Actinomycetota bacterium]